MNKRVSLMALCALLVLSACSLPKVSIFDSKARPLSEYSLEGTGKDKILLLSVNGMISSSPQKGLLGSQPSVVEQTVVALNKAAADKDIKALLLKVNSTGGTITASDILYNELLAYKKKTGNKIGVIMMDVAASGAYYISLPAEMIMAHPTTITGSVGVIMIRPKVSGLLDKVGAGVEITKFGNLKDMGTPYRPTTDEERALIQNTVDQLGKRFIGLVTTHRKLDAAALTQVSTARIFLADEALKLKLIDKIGYIPDAISAVRELAGLPADARVIVYRRKDMPEENYYRAAQASAETVNVSLINITLPDIFTTGAGFYYLWPDALNFE